MSILTTSGLLTNTVTIHYSTSIWASSAILTSSTVVDTKHSIFSLK